MLLLAFDTATPAVTVALHDGSRIVSGCTQIDARRHGELLAPGIVTVLAEAGRDRTELTDIAVGVGPGPYTGLRVGLMTARALGDALGIPVHGICTLDALAYASGRGGPFVAATDARRKEVYWARYADARTRTAGPAVDRAADIAESVAGLPAI
ncbi:MAG: tRNA (adenosine(37)-N6)-threonylcarbamoyltransferase complex dimerization subunit type 1 TsaB, partial [Streptomycetaceae bacterium]|nr:tRNA (adenosine(37)-N6)-threonylcarbamoyltransferase complex dimerization subunit type 1 TsaB [Streptomycetaceae bacterium]